jgi:phosphatidate cytidylyltransferase
MLKTRVLTAVILLSAFFLALFKLPDGGWLSFMTLIAAIAAWEWGALMKAGALARILLGVAMALTALAFALAAPAALGLAEGFSGAAPRVGVWVYAPATIFWVCVAPLWLKARWPLPQGALGVIVGALVIVPTWLAMIQLRQAGELPLIAVMATIWIADSGAYCFGRALGRHKLAPAISPGKTWEGAIGGGLAVIAYGLALSPRLPATLSENLPLLALILALFAAISVVGDLFESLLKRQAGLKDSSNLLPGHGGVLDRIDSLSSTLPLVAITWLKLAP